MRRIALASCLLAALAATSSAALAHRQSYRTLNGRLAFSVVDLEEIDGSATLAVSDPDGARRKVVLNGDTGVNTHPDWSPDGTRIAFTFITGNRYSGYTSDVYVANADGSGLRPLLPVHEERSSPSWSPDGSEIAYVQGLDDIYIAGADGSYARRLTTGLDPSWSPDGDRIVYAEDTGSGNTGLREIVVDGSGIVHLTGGAENDRAPRWSPNGHRILFQRGRGRVSIYSVGPDGSWMRRLTRGRYDTGAVWSPDGRSIAFARNGSIWVMRADGRWGRKVVAMKSASNYAEAPAWQPVSEVDGTVVGTRFDDYLRGGPGDEVFIGGAGRDRMMGGGGNDRFRARDGRIDTIDGGPGRDRASVDPNDHVRWVEHVVRR